jgi:glutathione S-transferase
VSNPTLTLYVDEPFMSPYALSVFVALTEKGLPFELKTVNLRAGEQFAPAYQSLSLTARVPTLTHGEFSLSESCAISEYLDEVFSPPTYAAIYPVDMLQRARARQVQAWLRSDLLPLREERPTRVIFQKPTTEPLSESARAAAGKLLRAADALIGERAEPLFGHWCIADTDLAVMMNRLVLNGDKVPEKLAAYAKREWQRPSVQAWLTRRDALRTVGQS